MVDSHNRLARHAAAHRDQRRRALRAKNNKKRRIFKFPADYVPLHRAMESPISVRVDSTNRASGQTHIDARGTGRHGRVAVGIGRHFCRPARGASGKGHIGAALHYVVPVFL